MLRIGLFLSHTTTLAAAALLLSPAALAQTRPAAAGPAAAQPAAAQPAAAAPAADECIPACRAGYVCARGQCVSSCNPPCASNEVCTAEGQCVATAPATATPPPGAVAAQPAYAAQPGVVAQPADQQPMALAAPEPPPAEKPQAEIRTFSFVPRLGIQGGGSVTLERKCEGDACPTSSGGSADADLKTAFAIGADFLFKVGDLFRLGPGLFHTFTTDVESSGVSMEAGSLTEINFVAEVIPRVSPVVWLVPRVQTGLALFSASGPLKTQINSLKDACNEAKDSASSSVSVNCSNFDNPHIGFDVGLGFGAMFAVSPAIRLRADAMYEYFESTLGSAEVSGGGSEANQTLKLSGSRYLLMGGAEF